VDGFDGRCLKFATTRKAEVIIATEEQQPTAIFKNGGSYVTAQHTIMHD
jgi:hypothetical protein